jgi:hypothetical protein
LFSEDNGRKQRKKVVRFRGREHLQAQATAKPHNKGVTMLKVLLETYGSDNPVTYELESAELHALREWFCYTKPLGPSTRITSDGASIGMAFGIIATGDTTQTDRPVKYDGAQCLLDTASV